MTASSHALISNSQAGLDSSLEPQQPDESKSNLQTPSERPPRDLQSWLSELLVVQQVVLDKIVAGANFAETLDSIATATEQVVEPTSCAIFAINERKTDVEVIAAPNLSPEFRNCLGQVRYAEHVASCPDESAAIDEWLKESPLCDAIRNAVVSQRRFPVRTEAIRSDAGEVLGILLLCSPTDHPIDENAERAIHAMTQLVRFAIEFERHNSALQSANERFTSLAASIPGVVYQRIVDTDGSMKYSYISEAARDLFGVPPEEIVANPQALFDCHGPDYAKTFRDRLLKASRELEMWDVEATINTRDGQRKYTHAIARPTRRTDGSVQWDGVILDSTRIKEAELATAAAEARMRDTIVESMPHGFVLFDSHDRLVTCNSRLRHLYPELESALEPGASFEEVVKAEIDCGLDVEAHIPEEGSGEIPSAESRLASRLECHAHPEKGIERRLADGRWILINEHRTSDGGTVILHTDVTELKDREAALKRSNRELQDFASVASHDLQEPLRKIEAFGDRLVARYGGELGDDGRMYIDRMQNAAGRMRSLINDLLSYSRVTTKAKPFVSVDLKKVATDVLSDLQVAIETSGAQVELDDLPTIDAEKTQMRMIFQNLIANAIKFREDGETPHISISAVMHDQAPPDTVLDVQAREVCEIRVKDNGIGFEMRHLERIFGIFQRLHGRNEYEGTGVGLATCRKIAELHGGTITAQSAPGEGTTFFVFLPAKQDNTGEQQ